MISLEEAYRIINENTDILDTNTILMSDCLNRVLAEDVLSDSNVPPFDKAILDGFACRKADLPGPFTIVDEIPAGKQSTIEIKEGQCARIMAGAPLPDGADMVFMEEQHIIQPDGSVVFTQQSSDVNIYYRGEDVRVGDIILTRGTMIRPQEMAVLAGAGREGVEVFRRPIVGVLSTGSELIEPTGIPRNAQIRNINGGQMIAQLNRIGMVADYFGIVPDDKEELKKSIQSIIKMTDVLFISGGVSMGDYDFVPLALQELDFEIFITSIAMRPGKYTLFAKKGNKYVLGFPGNPVSSFIQLELLGKHLLFCLMGHKINDSVFRCILLDDFERNATDRLEFIPVQLTSSGKVKLIPYHGSAHIHALSKANAIMEIPVGLKRLEQGDWVNIRPI
jgi:molybdopterin molybdotransferase